MPCSLKISVIVPVHNSATTIDRCIKSIVDQPYKNFECILIENGSSDDSKEICQKYVEAYECVKFAVSRKILRFLARNVLSVRMARQLVDILAVHHVLQILAVLVLL